MASRTRKISVVGARGVGKSTLVVQYVDNYFLESYYPTIQNQFNKSIKFRNQTYEVEILDTAGQDEFTIINDSTIVHGYILVYAINSRSSFELLPVIRDKILDSIGTDNVPMILVGNKVDLERKVSKEEGTKLAKDFGIPYIEVSAKLSSGENNDISKIFLALLEQIEGEKIDTTNEKCVIV
ncbi:Ras-related protein [Wickerhamomyces ciferrii]|uniref:Ras-related protein n=1 Tax=Wickerhamomyces ciferrii (strain ATCC 14091 / BCRC 22168 / CBS 111 / JCM 3599 / NBRC 0793 / NRRL Y-1031 F-60-10) TaxID=1206466 RepID=K0KNY4_WICCF|nr:Ras-related protein [Wickerhamomyces ciferrii]CCH43892.1 Ras-related protein [Wickerhamomyces ciferrii]